MVDLTLAEGEVFGDDLPPPVFDLNVQKVENNPSSTCEIKVPRSSVSGGGSNIFHGLPSQLPFGVGCGAATAVGAFEAEDEQVAADFFENEQLLVSQLDDTLPPGLPPTTAPAARSADVCEVKAPMFEGFEGFFPGEQQYEEDSEGWGDQCFDLRSGADFHIDTPRTVRSVAGSERAGPRDWTEDFKSLLE